MTKAQLAKLGRLQKAANKATKSLQEYTDSLKDGCTHPETHRSVFHWSYSNGYGRWSTENMPLCLVCSKVQYSSAYGHKWGKIPVNNYAD